MRWACCGWHASPVHFKTQRFMPAISLGICLRCILVGSFLPPHICARLGLSVCSTGRLVCAKLKAFFLACLCHCRTGRYTAHEPSTPVQGASPRLGASPVARSQYRTAHQAICHDQCCCQCTAEKLAAASGDPTPA